MTNKVKQNQDNAIIKEIMTVPEIKRIVKEFNEDFRTTHKSTYA